MVNPKLKVKYELHYLDTDVTGRSESEFESALIKLIYFPTQGELDGGTRYRVAIGFDVIADFDNRGTRESEPGQTRSLRLWAWHSVSSPAG